MRKTTTFAAAREVGNFNRGDSDWLFITGPRTVTLPGSLRGHGTGSHGFLALFPGHTPPIATIRAFGAQVFRSFCVPKVTTPTPTLYEVSTGVREREKVTHCMRIPSVVLLLVSLATGVSAHGDEGTRVSWATATKGGGFQLFGATIADVINTVDERLDVETLATRGSRQNLQLLEAGSVDVGQVEGNAARVALDGIDRPAVDLKVLSVMYPNPGMFVVRGDSDYRDIDDLKGHPIAFGTQASGLRILAQDVLDGLGLKPDSDFRQIILGKAAEGPGLVMGGEAEALWGAGIGWPGFVEIANGPAGARFIAPSTGQIERILRKHPHLREMTVPAGTYRGQEEDVRSVGLWSLILVRPDLDSETVYRLARAIHRGQGTLAERLPQGRYTRPENTVRYVTIDRLHPGAARYYREIGLLPADVGSLAHDASPLDAHAPATGNTGQRRW